MSPLFWRPRPERRGLVALLVLITMGAAVTAMALILAGDGLGWIDAAMLLGFAITLPNVTLGFWNAVIGVILMLSRKAAALRESGWSTQRVAVVMPICNEDPDQVFRHLRIMERSLLDLGRRVGPFEIHVLSDSSDPGLALEEERRFRAWRAASPGAFRLHYRRRRHNLGFKAGNIRDFVEGASERFDLMLVLDADSLMTGAAINRLAAIMEASPEIGILQPLIVGLPSSSPFSRIFQFGMRHGMRAFATGAAWWQADQGGYWGHNAMIRMRPFREHCMLPTIAGTGPLSGDVLSHDQVEAVLMRRAGYEVRVLPLEDGSLEQNPPTLPDFLGRDLRWCQGNMQYLSLLGLPGIRAVGRFQLLFAILMYLGSLGWMAFLTLGFIQAVRGGDGALTGIDPSLGLSLLAAMLIMSLGPKLLGLTQALLDPAARGHYGGAGRLLAGGLVEVVFSLFLGPVAALAHTIFILGLAAGHKVAWTGQHRRGRTLSTLEAARGLWPQTLLGAIGALVLAIEAPAVLPFAAPVLGGLLLSIPFAVLTSSLAVGRFLAWTGLCATPEELRPPPEVSWLDSAWSEPLPEPAGREVRVGMAAT